MRQKLLALSIAVVALTGGHAFAAATVMVDINGLPYTGASNPQGLKLVAGQPFSVDITIKGGKAADPIWLKHGDDIQMNGAGTNPQPDSDQYSFFLTPMHAGAVTLPGMDIPVAGGGVLHVNPIKLVVAAR